MCVLSKWVERITKEFRVSLSIICHDFELPLRRAPVTYN